MKKIAGLSIVLALVLVFAAIDFAAVQPETRSKNINLMSRVEEAGLVQNKVKPKHRVVKRKRSGNFNSAHRERRLTNSQRRYGQQLLRNIFLN